MPDLPTSLNRLRAIKNSGKSGNLTVAEAATLLNAMEIRATPRDIQNIQERIDFLKDDIENLKTQAVPDPIALNRIESMQRHIDTRIRRASKPR